MGKKIIMYLMVIGIFVSIYWQEHKRNIAVSSISVLQDVSIRPLCSTDPINLNDTSSSQAVANIYEGLYEYHYLKTPLEIVPNLAEKMPDISSDGLVYTFKIKQGVLFQDDACFPNGKGRTVQAADFIFTLKRIMDPKNSVPFLEFIDGKIKGFDAWKQQADYDQEVDGLKALDEHTFQVTLTEPWPNFLHFLTMTPSFVVAKEAVLHYGREFINHPVGTGPFTLQDALDPQSKQLTFVKNPTFRKKLFPTEAAPQHRHMLVYAGKRLPLLDKVITHIITEEQPAWLKMQKSEIDINPMQNSSLTLAIVKGGKLLQKFSDKGLLLEQTPTASTYLFVFNHNHALFSKNLYLRQAMSMAFDREAYNEMFYNKTAKVAYAILPPTLGGCADSALTLYGYNLARAKEYLAKAGYPNGEGLPIITLDTSTGTFYKNQANFFAKCMSKIGIKINVITNVRSELHNKIYKKHSTMMHTIGWTADYPDPHAMLEVISKKNLIGLQYVNSEFNTLLKQAAVTANNMEKKLIYAKLNQIVAEQVPVICAVHLPSIFLRYKWVKNFIYNGFNYAIDQYVSVDMKEKALATR